ncbi:MAG: hypothetical protein Q9187_000129 [Circinaria calcarea]
MTEPEELDEDLFADLYDGDEIATKPAPPAVVQTIPQAPVPTGLAENDMNVDDLISHDKAEVKQEDPDQKFQITGQLENETGGLIWQTGQTNGGGVNDYGDMAIEQEPHGPGIKEDGKMFIGGLNWETTDQSLKDYFSQFGEVHECTVMRDGATGRSRGFGFLTFKDARTVNIVMVKEHYLDGKILTFTPMKKIDPKRAIPRDEQERTSKIFVGGVSQDATEADFKEYFMQYGRVVDATLMIDKDTGRPRGFGFVTFDNESAVDATLQGDLTILGKPIEVKKAQPRGNMREEDEGPSRRGGRRGGKETDRFRDNDRSNFDNNNNTNSNSNNQNQGQTQAASMYGGGMTPQMMAQYWQRMQQYFAQMQQQMAAAQGGALAGPMGMAGMNPLMMQQMQQMQQMKQMQAMQQQMSRQQGSQSPLPQSPGAQGMPAMNPAIMQQMQQIQQMQMQSQQAQGPAGFGPVGMNGTPMAVTPTPSGPGMGGGFSNGGGAGGRRGTPGYNAQEQLLFEQQKYEQQQARRAAQEAQQMQQYQQGGPTSWEGMYDDVPQPNMGGPSGRGMQQGGFGRQASQGSTGSGNKGGQQQNNRASQGPAGPVSAPPANAPTGPKNAGVPGANYRGGGRGGVHRGGFHPYARK